MIGEKKKPKATKPTDKNKVESFYNVWDSLCDTPGAATTMKLRCLLSIALEDHIKTRRWSKAVAAKRCGASAARMAKFLSGKAMQFTADELAGMLGEAGIELEVRAVKSTFGTTPPEPKGKGA